MCMDFLKKGILDCFCFGEVIFMADFMYSEVWDVVN